MKTFGTLVLGLAAVALLMFAIGVVPQFISQGCSRAA